MYRSLGEFVKALEAAGELARVRAPVSPLLEVAQIADVESKSRVSEERMPSASARRNDPRFCGFGGRALLFENVTGSEIPVLINAFGSYRRLEMALGCNEAGRGVAAGHTPGGFDALAAKIGALVKPEPPRGWREALGKARQFAPLLQIPPRVVRRGACQEVVLTGDAVDLTRLPLIQCWPLDGDLAAVGYPAEINSGVRGADLAGDPRQRGRYITFAGIHTIHADDAGEEKPRSHNIGMYRVQLAGRRLLAMHWHMHHDGARHWRSWKRRGERMPVAIVFGGESVMPFAAIAPLPPGISELLMAGFLNRGGIPLVKCRTVPLRVPANAEIVIEGWVSAEAGPPGYDPRDPAAGPLGPGAFFEGPFGDHTGFYSLPDRYPLVEVTAITMRERPIFPATIAGLPPQEDYALGKATERIFLPLLKTLIPDVEDYDLPTFGAFHNCAALQIRKEYPLHARRVMHAVWGAGQMAWTKMIFVVDDDVDPHDVRAVLAAAAERCLPGRDIEIVNGPLDILDHAAPRLGAGCKVGFDCTRKIAGEEVNGVAVAAQGAAAEGEDAGLNEGLRNDLLSKAKRVPGVKDAAFADEGAGWLLVRMAPSAPGSAPAPGGVPGGASGAGTASPTANHTGRDVLERVLEVVEGRSAWPRFVIVVGPEVDVGNVDEALFHGCANMDPGRDAVRWGRRMGFDASPKAPGAMIAGQPVRDWPPVIRMSEAMVEQVRRRWGEYGL